MENLFKYIKVSDINPTLKIYYSDTETDGEENNRLLSSDDELLTTEDENEKDFEYEQMRRKYVFSELKTNNLIIENNKLKSKLIDIEEIINSIKNEINDLEIEKTESIQIINKLKNEKKEILENNQKKFLLTSIFGVFSGFIICYISKNNKI